MIYERYLHLQHGISIQVKSTENSEHVFSYLYPGHVIYQWHVEDKTIRTKLDCSKLIPCSESLKTINIDDQFSPGRCQVRGGGWGIVLITIQVLS